MDSDLHARLLTGDPLAPSDLCRAYLTRLTRTLAADYPGADPEMAHDAAVDAILDYATHPHRFDPARRSLFGYLIMLAHGDYLNRRQRRRAIARREVALRIDVPAPTDASESILDRIVAEGYATAAAVAAATDVERAVLALMLDGEDDTAAFTVVLGVEGLPVTEQRRHVYRVKDRLVRRLRRAGLRVTSTAPHTALPAESADQASPPPGSRAA